MPRVGKTMDRKAALRRMRETSIAASGFVAAWTGAIEPTPIRVAEWTRIIPPPPPMCDICQRRATWSHPAGGLRCDKCPRPK